jgi:hypothetical protein
MFITSSKASDGKFILMFESDHIDCKHEKHVANILDYTFIFCKATHTPIAIYCGAEVKEDEDVLNLVAELAEKYSILNGVIESPYFDNLSKALLDVEGIRRTG